MGFVFAYRKSSAQPNFDVAATISGTLEATQTLTCTWTVVRARDVNVSCVWYRHTADDGTDPTGTVLATGPTYTLTGSDVGCYVRCVVTAVNPAGSAQSITGYTDIITSGVPPSPPVLVTPATITGTPLVGNTLTVAGYSFTGHDTISIQWYSSAMESGDSNPTLLGQQTTQILTESEDARWIGVIVTASNEIDSTVTSAVVAMPGVTPEEPIAPATFAVTYSLPTGGATWAVNAGGDFQAALDGAERGDVIVLEAGATFTGNFQLKAKPGDGWIYIISSEMAELPADARIGTEHASLMPKIVPQSTNLPALRTLFGASHYYIAGIEFSTSERLNQLIETGYGLPVGETSVWNIRAAITDAELPRYIFFDRVLVRSTSDVNRLRMGINLNGRYMAVINSHIANCKDTADAQAIFTWQGDGPYKIVNNYLEATGENIIYGGSDPAIANSVPADIEIRGNYFYKPLSWQDPDLWTIKNSFELKNARRVLVEGNVIENNWTDGQDGYSVLVTVRNQSGTAPWCVVEDVWFKNNIIRDVEGAVNILTSDNLHPSQTLRRLKFTNNLMYNIYGIGRRFFKIDGPMLDYLTIEHNTMLFGADENTPNSSGGAILYPGTSDTVGDWRFNNNIAEYGGYGIRFSVFTEPLGNEGNVIYYDPANSRTTFEYNAYGNYYTEDSRILSFAGIGFTDAANRVYSLAVDSPYKNTATDGSDPGVDFAALIAATNDE